MAFRFVRSVLPVSVALAVVVGFASSAYAEGEDCLRDTDCGSSELCLGAVCTVPETVPPTCEAGCEFDETCDDGFCKVEGIACDNPAGRCWVEQDHGSCECFDGEGAGWSDGFNPDDPPETKTDEELVEECGTVLLDVCGSEAPMLPDTCVGEVLTDCEAFIVLENTAIGDCGEGTPEVTIARVGQCCDTYDQQDYAEYRACMSAEDTPTCGLLNECEGGNDTDAVGEGNDGDTDGGTDPTGGDTDQGASAADEDTSSCAVGSGGSQGWTLLGLFGLLPFVRRRR